MIVARRTLCEFEFQLPRRVLFRKPDWKLESRLVWQFSRLEAVVSVRHSSRRKP